MPDEEISVATALTNYDEVKSEILETYSDILAKTKENDFFKEFTDNVQSAIDNLAISDEKKADAMISLYAQLANSTVSRSFDQAIILVDKSMKLLKEANLLDKDLDIKTEQYNELKESVEDRKQKRTHEVGNLTKQGELLAEQVKKLKEEILYVIAQKDSMLEQVNYNNMIKAMDSMADMIGTVGAGGLKPTPKMFEIFFELNKLLSGIIIPLGTADLTVTKA